MAKHQVLPTGHQLPVKLWGQLLPYQRDGVLYALAPERAGRALIADEMGLGKTLQAIAVALCCRDAWPLLIAAPSSLRLQWAEELERWGIDILEPGDVHVIADGRDARLGAGNSQQPKGLSSSSAAAKVTILSYGLATKSCPLVKLFATRPGMFGFVIADEAHYLRDSKSQRCKVLTPILKAAKHLLLLTGTPAVNKPADLFPQLHALAPAKFPAFFPFAERYCGAQRNRFNRWEFNGCTNEEELRAKLASVMVRRLKADVLSQLPPKRRHRVVLTLDGAGAAQVDECRNALKQQEATLGAAMAAAAPPGAGAPGGGGGGGGGHTVDELRSLKFEGQQLLNDFYVATAAAKTPAVCAYVSELLGGGVGKLVVFAHHLATLDTLERHLATSAVGVVRLEGKTGYDERHRSVKRFQEDPSVQVALLSMTACGTGLTLTAASTVVFAELHWNPAVIMQAEDRTHRIGQAASINVHYCIARSSVDEMMWPVLDRKLNQIASVVDGAAAVSSAAVAAGDAVSTDSAAVAVGASLTKSLASTTVRRDLAPAPSAATAAAGAGREAESAATGGGEAHELIDLTSARASAAGQATGRERKEGLKFQDVARLFQFCASASRNPAKRRKLAEHCWTLQWACSAGRGLHAAQRAGR